MPLHGWLPDALEEGPRRRRDRASGASPWRSGRTCSSGWGSGRCPEAARWAGPSTGGRRGHRRRVGGALRDGPARPAPLRGLRRRRQRGALRLRHRLAHAAGHRGRGHGALRARPRRRDAPGRRERARAAGPGPATPCACRASRATLRCSRRCWPWPSPCRSASPASSGSWGVLLTFVGGFVRHPLLALILAASLVASAAAHARMARLLLFEPVDPGWRKSRSLEPFGGRLPDATSLEMLALVPIAARRARARPVARSRRCLRWNRRRAIASALLDVYSLSASAPPMISISSLVIAAWRARL